MHANKKIGVLCGGLSGQRDVSLRTGEAVRVALEERGHDACPIYVDRDVDAVLRHTAIDVAFIALHGRYGEDGCIQGLLETVGIPYTGSGVLASALAMNKVKTKEILRLHNLPTSPGYLVLGETAEAVCEQHQGFGFPVVVKPVGEGSSLGVAVAHDEVELEQAVEAAQRFGDDVLVERLIVGREVSVAVLDGRPLGAIEVVPRKGDILDFKAKVMAGHAEHHAPPRLSLERYRSVLRLGALAHEALGCEGVSRIDMIVSERGNEVILEVNTLPSLDANGLLPKIAHSAGLSFEDLVEQILAGARLRAHGHRRERRTLEVSPPGPERRAGMFPPPHAH